MGWRYMIDLSGSDLVEIEIIRVHNMVLEVPVVLKGGKTYSARSILDEMTFTTFDNGKRNDIATVKIRLKTDF